MKKNIMYTINIHTVIVQCLLLLPFFKEDLRIKVLREQEDLRKTAEHELEAAKQGADVDSLRLAIEVANACWAA